MSLSNKRVYFNNYAFEVCENVYEPSEDSFFFAENLPLLSGARVLDMGTGTGILGILAAENAQEVLLVDLNPFSIRCAKKNSLLNKLKSKIEFLQSDLFSSLSGKAKFDKILFNSPYLPIEEGEVESWIGLAWAGGTTGRQVIDKFICEAPQHLEESGEIFLLQSNFANVEETRGKFLSVGLKTNITNSFELPFFEKLFLVRAIFV